MSDASLHIWIKGCLDQQRKSQEELYRHFYGYAMSICMRYTKNENEAVEVLNDSFLKVFTSLHQYDQSRPFQSWFRRIIIHTAINYYHQHKKHNGHQPIEEAHQVSMAQDILEQCSYQEIVNTIQKLSPVYRTVLNMFIIDGYSHEEIAEALHISIGTSKSNLSRARSHLKVLLNKDMKHARYE